jgi:ABC-2 type transport system ATP-binding protein
MEAIITTNLKKKYGDFTAVDNLNLTINQGELFSLLGLNGAGKTTTIKMLTCLLKPTSGDAILLQDSINENTQSIKKRINISPQETAIAPNLTVKENLELVARLYGQDANQAVKSAKEMAATFGLEGIMVKKARILSGGMQRRLSIAMALISNPEILFLDEPTLGLDVLARRELWTAIKALKGKITIVLTTHYLEEAEALSDRVGVMTEGKLIAVGTALELTKQTSTSNLEEAFITLNGGSL